MKEWLRFLLHRCHRKFHYICLLNSYLVMRTLLVLAIAFVTGIPAFSQVKTSSSTPPPVSRPKLVVGIVVDQMRWDYLYRYYDRYASDGGFKRMLNQGFSCENTLIPY